VVVKDLDQEETNIDWILNYYIFNMRYTGPKFKLCRREGVNIFWPAKYNPKKRRTLPGQHGKMMARLTDYGKLLRNKQLLKRTYMLSERQFKNIVVKIAAKYSKNHNIDYDKAVSLTLERRLDATLLRAGYATTIMMARQMVGHGHLMLNGKKHNIPSYLINEWDIISIRERSKNSPLFTELPVQDGKFSTPVWLNVDKSTLELKINNLPDIETINMSADVLKVVEYYAR